jgi:hypothetical protein
VVVDLQQARQVVLEEASLQLWPEQLEQVEALLTHRMKLDWQLLEAADLQIRRTLLGLASQ